MKKRFWILFFAAAVVLVAGIIFYFSAQDGPTSSKTSEGLTLMILRWVHPEYDALPKAERNRLLQTYQFAVRKCAHFSEFALLGVFLLLLFNALKMRWKAPLGWIAGTLYACTDELHQMAVSARGPTWQDVCIDSAGVLFGVLLALALVWLRRRRKRARRAA